MYPSPQVWINGIVSEFDRKYQGGSNTDSGSKRRVRM